MSGRTPAFGSHGARSLRRFGVEEEYLLLDARTGAPVDIADGLVEAMPDIADRAEREFFSSQLETATPVCVHGDDAEHTLGEFRARAAQAAAEHGAVLAGTGLPPVGGTIDGTVTPKQRYREIVAQVRAAGRDQYTTGTHVHVEVPSRDAGVDAMARLGRWAPALVALTANSPYWCGRDTGFASWRHVQGLRWPVAGYPPSFIDGEDYDRSVMQLAEGGVVLDAGVVTWVARLSARFPTLEVRIADAQLDAADATAFAVLLRAIVEHCLIEAENGVERPRAAPGLVNGAIWLAARDGLDAQLTDPFTGRVSPAFTAVDMLREIVDTELIRSGDVERVDAYLSRLRADGGPARRQRERFERDGIEGLIDLFREGGRRGRSRLGSARETVEQRDEQGGDRP